MHLFYQPRVDSPDPVPYLTEDDSRHAVKTLRLGIGDAIAVTDGHGNRFPGVITTADARQCAFRVTGQETTPARPFLVRLCVAPTKNLDRIEWFVEKAVEIGVERISFFVSQHSERRVLKTDRIMKIAVAAMKQSLQSWLPVIDEAVPFAQLLADVGGSQRFVAHLPTHETPLHLAKAALPGGSYAVLIGPEGDFSTNELTQAANAGFRMVTLGNNRLRTETAALSACQILTLVNL